MSWTPIFWMTKKDFEKPNIKSWLKDIESVEVYEFNIIEDGVAICSGNTSYTHREVHEIIQAYPHWILSSEDKCCENGRSWGEELEEFFNY